MVLFRRKHAIHLLYGRPSFTRCYNDPFQFLIQLRVQTYLL